MPALRQIWLACGWLWVALVCYLSLTPQPPQPITFDGIDKIEHLMAYAGLMLWFCQVYVTGPARIRLFAGMVALGVTIECLQGMSGYRYFEFSDMLANTAGVLLGWVMARGRLGRVILVSERNVEQ